MRSRSELYDILVDELRMDNAKATEILDNAFAPTDDEIKKRDENIEELKKKFVGKLLYIDCDTDNNLPTCIFVNDIKVSYIFNYVELIGPHIVLDENEFYFYSIEDYSLTIGQDKFDKIEIINTQYKKQFIYRLIEKRVENCMNKFIDECKID